MKNRFKKMAVLALTAAMLLQQCAVTGLAEELTQVTEAQMQAEEPRAQAAEAPAATEAPTEAPAATEAPTEAPAATETPTEAPAATEAPVETPAVTEASTEKQTAAEEAQTESPDTKNETATETETETERETETEPETEVQETERADRINDGKKIEDSMLLAALKGVLPYLFAGEQVTLPEELEQEIDEELILDEAGGSEAVKALGDVSLTLANGKSSKMIAVLNVYADNKGKLDIRQIEDAFSDRVIDVTDQYYVVNVIAAKKNQKLTFSGYQMKNGGNYVDYEKAAQRGDILYNFAYLDGETYRAFEGEVELSSGSGLQGTFLAPAASVKVQSDLAGAVYAKRITVAGGVQELLRIAYLKGGAQEETETDTTEASTADADAAETDTTDADMTDADVTEIQVEETGETVLTEAGTSEGDTEAVEPPSTEESETEAADALIAETEAADDVIVETETASAVISEIETGNRLAEPETIDEVQAVLQLIDTDDAVITNCADAVFVVKDAAGKVMRDENNRPRYYLTFAEGEQQLDLYGLADGEYFLSELKTPAGYQAAPDQSFTIATGVKQEIKIKHAAAGTKTVSVVVQPRFNSTVLTAETNQQFYMALFADAALTSRVSEVKSLTYTPSASQSEPVDFAGMTDGTYYAGITDACGEVESETDRTYQLQVAGQNDAKLVLDASDVGTKKQVAMNMEYTTYPENFSYLADVPITMEVKNLDGSALISKDTFYAMLFRDEAYTEKALDEPVVLAMNQSASVTVAAQVKMTAASGTLYLAETDAQGMVRKTDDEAFEYGITYPDGRMLHIVCGAAASGRIQNQINDSIVKLHVEDKTTKELLEGAELVVKNRDTGALTDVFVSGKTDTVWTNKLAAGSYVLTEITAPSGYGNTADVEFTVEEGKTIQVVMRNAPLVKTSYRLTAVKQVYNGDAPVYARDVSGGTYAKEGRYTFYAALFSDKERTKKVSDVQKITVEGLSGTTVFANLTKGTTYYLAETDQYGTVLRSADPRGEKCTVQYTKSGKATVTSSNAQLIIRNTYSSLPRGYRNTATLTITKKLQNASGEADSAAKTFYAGIFRTSDYSDTPTVVALKLENTSSSSAKRRILLSGTKDVTYYIAEVDQDGRRITEESEFGYTISIDQPSVTLSGGDDKNVTITNRKRVSKVTLYLTKKVYEGTAQKAVQETFYAGLFKDPEFTQLYAKPIELKLDGKSQVTLKLTLNLGSASEAKIYVAEVDKDGKVAKAGEDFGYDIRVVNATAEFTQEQTEIQSILLNSVYSDSSGENWNQILNSDGNNIGMGGGGGGWSSNGGGNASENGSVQTGDDTPILPYVIGLVVAVAVMIAAVVIGRKKKKTRQ